MGTECYDKDVTAGKGEAPVRHDLFEEKLARVLFSSLPS